MVKSMKLSRKLDFKEEVGNAVTHFVGALAMLALLPVTTIHSYAKYDTKAVAGMTIFVISLFLMFMASAIYHTMAYGSMHKYVSRIVDHSMIYIAIAGSYTPLALSVIGGVLGYVIMGLQWGITVFGILYKIFRKKVNEKFSLILYLAMGWLAIFVIPSIVRNTGITFMILMVAGGLLYSIGAFFYTRKYKYSHMIWHLFILAAAVTHYVAIVYFML